MRLLHQAFFHRVAVDVAQLLLNDVRSAQPHGMQVVLPELKPAFRTAQMSKEPFTAALLRVLLDGLHHGLGREFLVVAQDVLQRVSRLRPGDQVDVVAHDAPREKLQALGLLTIAKALYEDVLIGRAREDIHPAHRGIGQVVQVFLVVDLVVARHRTKIPLADHRSAVVVRP